ncbi:MAG: SGNH/GDSL hydrolase family protein [Clostridia bacterium]|nr:SGNH/GDSL hydrolase family protein [Clostridia bacterium]
MFKKILCVLMATVLVLSFAACNDEVSFQTGSTNDYAYNKDESSEPASTESETPKNEVSSNSQTTSGSGKKCANHNFVESKIITEPTTKIEGSRLLKCSKCGEEKTETIAKLVFKNNSIITENGVKKAVVKRINGSKINVNVVPNKVLFLGNSLLLGMSNYSYGMCATDAENDYYHHVTQAILAKNPNCKFERAHIAHRFEAIEKVKDFNENILSLPWKNNGENSPALGDLFTKDLDLIIIQAGDNINNSARKAAFTETCGKFVELIKEKCPKARIIWVYGWYQASTVEQTVIDTCAKWEIECVSLDSIHVPAHEATINQTYVTENGGTDYVKSDWITHPGNAGMKKVADAILNKINM